MATPALKLLNLFLQVSRTSVNTWVKAYLDNGLDGLKEKPRTGRPAYLSVPQQQQLARFINDKAESNKGGALLVLIYTIY